MSTPRTDAACGWPWGHHGRIETSDLRWSPDGPFVHSSVARELERENAALRKDKERLDWLESNLYTLWASGLRCNELPAVEIAARSGRFEAESIRDAIDAAR